MTSPTEDQGKLLAAIAKVKISGGKSDFSSALQIAQLALKHRKNPNGGKRIVLFVGSPVTELPEELEKIGLFLKKNTVAIDIISIGQLEDNQEKMTNFINLVDFHGFCKENKKSICTYILNWLS
jgi:26S proteasome regulatory subunit N10